MTSGVGFRSERGPVLIALMLATGLVAIDSTIVATAVPSIVASLGGFSEFPWLFSVYLLAQAVAVPVYGKLADLFGRKPVMLFGIGAFLVGSIACGLAWSMPALIGFRVVQGLGAGAVQPMSMTIAGDLYSVSERAKVQGYLASVWGVSSVAGPALGGLFSEYASWRWIFLVNIPLCLLAGAMILRAFTEQQVDRTRHVLDYRGATLLTAGSTMVVLGVLEGDQAWAWVSAPSLVMFGGGLLLVLAFVGVELHAAEPVLPLWVFTRRTLLTTSLTAAAAGALVLGLTSYVPTFVQGVLGHGPVVAGFALATLTIGWPIAASQAGRIYMRAGFRRCALLGCAFVVLGAVLLTFVGRSSGLLQIAGPCLVLGAGLGWVVTPSLIAAQTTVDWGQRGVVTGNNMFCRALGSAVGVAIFGAIANATLGSSVRPGATPSPAALTTATQHVFLGVVALALGLVVTVALMPRDPASSAGQAAPTMPAEPAPTRPAAPSNEPGPV